MNDFMNCLQRVHKVQLEMALEVKRICQKHNIKYSIIAGTLLGAARHKGFIPWDDDLDIGMLRNEYEKFINIANKELKGEYFLQTWDTDFGFALPIAKLRKKGTKFIEHNSSKAGLHNGIYIDIFPFDNIPNSTFRQNVQNLITYILKRIILIKKGYELWEGKEYFKKFIYKSINIIAKPLSLKKAKSILFKEMTRFNSNRSISVVTFGGSYGYRKESIKRKWLDSLTTIKFETFEISCPKDYKYYLSYFYGDYMTPPPEDKRYNRHMIIEIEFEEEM